MNGGVKTGIDKRGRKYRSVNGKRVSVSGETPNPPMRTSRTVAAPRDSIRRLMRRWFGNTKSGQETAAAIKQLLKTKFNLWFSIEAKTKVGRQGRLYAMRLLLKKLGDKTSPREFVTENRDLDYPKFMRHLKTHHGVEVSDPESEEPENDDQKMLKMLHDAGINAAKLGEILRRHTK